MCDVNALHTELIDIKTKLSELIEEHDKQKAEFQRTAELGVEYVDQVVEAASSKNLQELRKLRSKSTPR